MILLYATTVATIRLPEAELRNSQRYMPCHVPRLSRPLLIGIERLAPTMADFACDGMSSSPSYV